MIPVSKLCSDCRQAKPISDFRIIYPTDYTKSPHYSSYCDICTNLRNANQRLIRKYGITRQQKDQMLSDQAGVCKLCKSVNPSGRELVVDHVKGTRIVRGLLCYRCNTLLANHSPEFLRQCVEYVEKKGAL